MDIHSAAKVLHGMQYRQERKFSDHFKAMKEAGLVAVTGASDDIIEFYGAIGDELGAKDIPLLDGGILKNECDDRECPYFAKLEARALMLRPVFDGRGDPSFTYEVDIEHASFDVMEDDDIYCRGIVFRVSDIP